jgi:two-component system chemotaxis response regulator CheY
MLQKELFYTEATRITDEIELLFTQLQEEFNHFDVKKIALLIKELHENAKVFELNEIAQFIHKTRIIITLVDHNHISYNKKVEVTLRTAIGLIEDLYFQYLENKKVDTIQENLYSITKEKLDNIIDENKQHSFNFNQRYKPAGTSILFVDDSIMIRKICEKVAALKGYNVLLANDGLDGLRFALNYDFDLICSDINMPKLNGLEMVKEIKRYKEFEFTPIIMLTTERDPQMISYAKSMGVKSWLTKPFTLNKLEYTFEKILSK